MYRSPDHQINWPFGSGEYVQNRVPRQRPWCHLVFLIGAILALFYLQVNLMLSIKFQDNWPFVSGEDTKNTFSRWRPWLFFIYKSPLCFLSSSMSTGLSIQKKKLNGDFKDGHFGGHFGFLIGTILAIFGVQVTSSFLPSFKSIGLLVQKAKRKIAFQDGRHGGHLGFPIGTILAILIYKSSRYFLPSFKSNGLGV